MNKRHPQVRNPFERRKPRRVEIKAAKELAKAVGPLCLGLFEAKEVK
jgi:hypothetical protein